MHAMEKNEELILFTLFIGDFVLCIQFLRRRRRLRQDDNDDEDAKLLEDILQLEANRRSSCELKDEDLVANSRRK